MTLRTRFAPTPSGFLHWGNAFSFVLTWLYARKNGGQIVLRIDDLDSVRKRPEFVDDVFRSLEWLGLDYDEGPAGPDDFEANFSQRHRLQLYQAQLSSLAERKLVFGCKCTRSTIRESADGQHPASCKNANMPASNEMAWRVSTPLTPITWQDHTGMKQSVDLHASMRDFVVRRKDGIPAYQLASVIDDAQFDINFIVRGEDLLDSSAAQRWLSSLLLESGFADTDFVHHPLARDEAGDKLSKSAGAVSLKAMRESGASPAGLYERISPLLGFVTPIKSAREALVSWEEPKVAG